MFAPECTDVRGHSLAPAILPWGKKPPVSNDQKQRCMDIFGANFLDPAGNQTQDDPAHVACLKMHVFKNLSSKPAIRDLSLTWKPFQVKLHFHLLPSLEFSF
jgi:hypothetical protein